MKKIVFLLITFLFLCLLSGCWSYSELNERTIVAGAAIDRLESGEILLTAETIDFTGGESPGAESAILTGKGRSIAEAVYDIMNQSGKELYWYHATLLILDNKYAKEGIQELLDFLVNQLEMRLTLTLAVSRLETAAEVLQLDAHGSNIKSFAITSIIQEQSRFGKTVHSNAYQVINRAMEPGVEFALAQIMGDVTEKNLSVDVAGCALFRGDQLVGWLDDKETIMMKLLLNSMEETEIEFLVDESHISVKTDAWKVQVHPEIEGDGATMRIAAEAMYEVLMLDGNQNMNDPDTVAQLDTALGAYVKECALDLIKRLQGLSCDALGWGNMIWQKDPAAYREFLSWTDVFQTIPVELTVTLQNRSSSSGMRVSLS